MTTTAELARNNLLRQQALARAEVLRRQALRDAWAAAEAALRGGLAWLASVRHPRPARRA